MHRVHQQRNRSAFTLIEMLVVITIIAILASMLMPAVTSARKRAREAPCMNNMHQASLMMEMYHTDYDTRTPYLSRLRPDYDLPREMLVCEDDDSNGAAGCKPGWDPGDHFPEADELLSNKAGTAAFEQQCAADYDRSYNNEYKIDLGEDLKDIYPYTTRNPDVKAGSYLYTYNVARCPFCPSGFTRPDQPKHRGNGDGVVSWREYMEAVEYWGLQTDGTYSKSAAYKVCVPIIRCFFHTTPEFGPNDRVLNLGLHQGVYICSPTTEGWKDVCGD